MRASSRNLLGVLSVVVMVGVWLPPASIRAENVVLDDDSSSSDTTRLSESEAVWGLGVRVRQVRIPESLLESVWLEDVPGSRSHLGYGIELIRQKGNFTLSLGVEAEDLSAEDGIWIDKGESIPQDPVDYVEFKEFGWIGADISFTWQHALISDVLFFRYGAGLGLGIIRGEILQTDYICTTEQTDSCDQDPNAMNIQAPVDLPPVFPIVNVAVGAQVRPVSYLAINIEGGIRTVPFFGTTIAFMY